MKDLDPGAITILYVDDEEMARKYFDRSFGADYEVLTAADADDAVRILLDKEKEVGIVVTDYRMPGLNGGDLLRQIESEFRHIVRILVTAYADREVLLDTVNSGEVFRILEKPLDLGEVGNALRLASGLLRERRARQQRLMAIDETLAFLAHELNTPLAAILNFAQRVQRRVAPDNPEHITIGKIVIDRSERSVYVDNREIAFSDAEFDLLWLLASNPGKVLSRDDILRATRGLEYDGLDRSIDMRISRLRKLLGDDSASAKLIKSVRSKGYLFSKREWNK